MKLDRRHFAVTAAVAPLAFAAGKAAAQTTPQPGAAGPSLAAPPPTGAKAVRQIVARLATDPVAQPLECIRNKQTPKLKPVALNEVRLGDGAFQECSGLEVEMDVAEYVEGGRNNGVVQRAGRTKVTRIILKRGMLHPIDGTVNADLWQWFMDVVDGVRPLRRYDGTIEVLAPDGGATVATWAFSRGLPAKVVGPQLNAKTGELAIEELQIAHERLRLVVG